MEFVMSKLKVILTRNSYCFIGHFYTALFSAPEQTHFVHVACDSDLKTILISTDTYSSIWLLYGAT